MVFDTYWRFAAERQRVFFRRAAGGRGPWSDDQIIQTYKFTNAYRASDRVSQYLIRSVIGSGDSSGEELLFRILLFKLFNRIETWELLTSALGATPSWRTFELERYDEVLEDAISSGVKIYSAAYIMPSGSTTFGTTRKHRAHLLLLERMISDGLDGRLLAAQSMAKAFDLLISYPTIGPFLAYQFVTDINYSSLIDFPEDSFVVPGPGALDGISKCFDDLGELDAAGIVAWTAKQQEDEFWRLGEPFDDLFGRRLQWIDCQNLFCEISKYARVKHPEIQGASGRTRIKQRFKPKRTPIALTYPKKWGLDERVEIWRNQLAR